MKDYAHFLKIFGVVVISQLTVVFTINLLVDPYKIYFSRKSILLLTT